MADGSVALLPSHASAERGENGLGTSKRSNRRTRWMKTPVIEVFHGEIQHVRPAKSVCVAATCPMSHEERSFYLKKPTF